MEFAAPIAYMYLAMAVVALKGILVFLGILCCLQYLGITSKFREPKPRPEEDGLKENSTPKIHKKRKGLRVLLFCP